MWSEATSNVENALSMNDNSWSMNCFAPRKVENVLSMNWSLRSLLQIRQFKGVTMRSDVALV